MFQNNDWPVSHILVGIGIESRGTEKGACRSFHCSKSPTGQSKSGRRGPDAAKAWTKWFGRYLDKLGIIDERKGLHSLRHTFKDALRAGVVHEELSDALTGHSNATVGRSYGARARHARQRHKTIIDRFGMAQMVEAIGKVKYPGIDLQAVCRRTTGNNISESRARC